MIPNPAQMTVRINCRSSFTGEAIAWPGLGFQTLHTTSYSLVVNVPLSSYMSTLEGFYRSLPQSRPTERATPKSCQVVQVLDRYTK